MSRKGKDKVPKIDPAYQAAFDAEKGLVQQQLSLDERERLAKLSPDTAALMRGPTVETFPLSVLDEFKEADATAPTTLCTEHVPNEEHPMQCAKCGKPFSLTERKTAILRAAFDAPAIGDYVGKTTDGKSVFVLAVDTEARSVRIGELGKGDTPWLNETEARAQFNYEWGKLKPIPWMQAEQASHLAGLDPEPAIAIAITEGQLHAALDDGPTHEPEVFGGMVEIPEPWFSRAVTMATRSPVKGANLSAYLCELIKRQWIASGAGKGKR